MDNNVQNILATASGYAKGATSGLIGGFVLGVLFKGNLFYWAVGGLLVGGYAGHLISEANDDSKKTVFKPIF